MSRLLHAAARGARIMYQIDTGQEKGWIPAVVVRTDNIYKYRIHPADAHLGYGPISTALREMAINDLWPSKCWKCAIASSAANEFTVYFDSRTGEPDYPLFYLFLAEFLADEGM